MLLTWTEYRDMAHITLWCYRDRLRHVQLYEISGSLLGISLLPLRASEELTVKSIIDEII